MKRKYTSDESVIQGILCSDNSALAYLYKEYAEMVTHLILTNSGTKDDAEDVFQDTIIILYEKIKANIFVLKSSLKTYIYSVSRNLWLYRLRQKSRDDKITESFMAVAEEYVDVDFYYEENDKDAKMTDYFRLLGESCRKILLLF